MKHKDLQYGEKRKMPAALKIILIILGLVAVFAAGVFCAYPVMRLYDWIVSLF